MDVRTHNMCNKPRPLSVTVFDRLIQTAPCCLRAHFVSTLLASMVWEAILLEPIKKSKEGFFLYRNQMSGEEILLLCRHED